MARASGGLFFVVVGSVVVIMGVVVVKGVVDAVDGCVGGSVTGKYKGYTLTS